MNAGDQGAGERVPRDPPDQARDVVLVETTELQPPSMRLAGELRDRLLDGAGRPGVGISVRADDEQRRVPVLSCQELKQQERSRVGAV